LTAPSLEPGSEPAGARAAAAVGVILAAGAGQRLGGVAKALLRLGNGMTLLEAVVTCARAAGVSRCVVVVGPPHDGVTTAEAARLGVAVTYNPAPHRGMASSVALGFEHLLACCAGATVGLLWPVDHATVQPESVRVVLRACAADGAVVPTYQGRGGHPAAFGRSLWPALAACVDAPEGARSVLRSLARDTPGRVLRIEIDDIGVLADVDTPEDR
jgi:molybdenum cofactor cytidylyltransferase